MKINLNRNIVTVAPAKKYEKIIAQVDSQNYEVNVAKKMNGKFMACLTKPSSCVEMIAEKKYGKQPAIGCGTSIVNAVNTLLKNVSNRELFVTKYHDDGKVSKYTDYLIR